MPITELENNSSWVKVFANKTSHYMASWYRQPGGTSEDFQLFRDQLDHIRNQYKGKTLPSVHVLGDFNFKGIDWPDRLNKSGSALSQSEEQMFMVWNNRSLLFLVSFRIFSPRTISAIMLELLKVVIPHIKTPRRKVYLYQKGDYKSTRKDAFEFGNEHYFNGYADTREL